MKSDWILDVLLDLRNFAKANELYALADQLDDTAIVALAEIAEKLDNKDVELSPHLEDHVPRH